MEKEGLDEIEQERMINQAAITSQTNRNMTEAAQYYLEEKEKGIVDIQLEVESIKLDIYHLLRQDRLILNKENNQVDWVELEDLSQRTLSDWGVERIMQVINFYINKNTLLTNFDEKQIRKLMLTFMTELNDLILMKYQLIFNTPTFEECKIIMLNKLEEKKKLRIFTSEILGKEYDEKEISKELLGEMERTVEKEMSKIKAEQRKEKLRDYGILIAQLEVIVYATLNRAWKGEERGSIRRHTQISELIGGRPSFNTNKSSGGGMFSWGSR